jgi:hypothetical protein
MIRFLTTTYLEVSQDSIVWRMAIGLPGGLAVGTFHDVNGDQFDFSGAN